MIKLKTPVSHLVHSGILLVLLLPSGYGQEEKDPYDIQKWDTAVAYLLVIVWAIIQWFLHFKLSAITKRTVLFITFIAVYIQCWIYVAFLWLIVGLVLALKEDWLFNSTLTAVAAKTIAFLLLDRVSPPPQGVADCLEQIHNATRVKYGYYETRTTDEEEGPINENTDSTNTKVWVKFVLVYVKERRYKKLRNLLEEMKFQTGKWEGINEIGRTGELRLNSLKDANKERTWTQKQLQELYNETKDDREKVHATGCIFTSEDYRIAKKLTKKSWVDVFNDECDGDWFYLLARQLQGMLGSETLNAPLDSSKFFSSCVYGRLRRRVLVQSGTYTPSLVDIHLFEAAVHESFRKEDKMDVNELIKIMYDSKTYQEAANKIFTWICSL